MDELKLLTHEDRKKYIDDNIVINIEIDEHFYEKQSSYDRGRLDADERLYKEAIPEEYRCRIIERVKQGVPLKEAYRDVERTYVDYGDTAMRHGLSGPGHFFTRTLKAPTFWSPEQIDNARFLFEDNKDKSLVNKKDWRYKNDRKK